MRWQFRWLPAVLVAALAGVSGCGQDAGSAPDPPSPPEGEVTVFAAASLTDAFGDIAERFTREHPGVGVAFNFAGSQVLASQISEGAPADVFASANVTQMDVVVDAGAAAGDPVAFAGNALAIAVEPGNPFGIAGLADLADPDLVVVLPAGAVPAGRYARAALDAAGVAVSPASLEQDVRAALSKVALGEADASIVYASDVAAAAGRVDGVEIPAEDNIPVTYPITALAGGRNPAAADAFVAFVRGDTAQRILAGYGFAAP